MNKKEFNNSDEEMLEEYEEVQEKTADFGSADNVFSKSRFLSESEIEALRIEKRKLVEEAIKRNQCNNK